MGLLCGKAICKEGYLKLWPTQPYVEVGRMGQRYGEVIK